LTQYYQSPLSPIWVIQVKRISNLKPATAQIIIDAADKLKKVNGAPAGLRKKLTADIMKAQLGANGSKADQLIAAHWAVWKGSAATDSGSFIRWAAGSNFRSPAAATKALERFGDFLVKEGQMTTEGRAKVKKKLESNIEKDGVNMRAGMAVSNEANKILVHAHNNQTTVTKTGKKKKPKTTVTIYRTWRPDQVKQMGIKPMVGKKIRYDEPTVHSWSFINGVFTGVAHGAMRTKATVPINSIQITDRLNNHSGHIQKEDELIFLAPDTELEIVKVA
jgi:hypothetical protein